ncbi:hypothetical protein C5S32_07840 [ANME-1 cluster archaeon GoMg1]|nr:hypothetical protein [ANME-1 cluster archaeon GoMg1]
MEKVDEEGKIIGFSILKEGALKLLKKERAVIQRMLSQCK